MTYYRKVELSNKVLSSSIFNKRGMHADVVKVIKIVFIESELVGQHAPLVRQQRFCLDRIVVS